MDAVPEEVARPRVVPVPATAGPDDIDSYLSVLEEPRGASSYVLRVSYSLVETLKSADALTARRDIMRRVSSTPVFAIAFSGGNIVAYRVQEEDLFIIRADELLRHASQADLLGLVESCKELCYYPENPRFHYIAPSGMHCRSFFRVGDAIRSLASLESLTFWLLPIVSRSDALLLDTWSISSAVLNAFLYTQAKAFDCLSEHPKQNRQAAERCVAELARSIPAGGRLGCIISVTSSGRFTESIRLICDSLGIRVEFLSIYHLAGVSADSHTLCELDLRPTNSAQDECPDCQHGSLPIAIHPSLYYLKEYPETGVPLGRDHFVRTPDDRPPFLHRHHSMSDVLGIHHDDREGRHHAFHVDIARLLDDQAFLNRFSTVLKALPQPDLILTPNDDTSRRMGAIAGTLLTRPVMSIDFSRLGEHSLPSASRSFLVVDDVLITGARMAHFNARMREMSVPPESLSYVIGLARPISKSVLRKQEISLTRNVPWKAAVRFIEEMLLPDWNSQRCPWCQEQDFLSMVASRLAEPPSWLTQRLRDLAVRNAAERTQPLWLLPGGDMPRLGHGSLAGPEGMTAMATMFSLAEALQHLRHDEEPSKRLSPYFPDFNVFASRNLRNYSEILLRAVLLRIVLRVEWGGGAHSREVVAELLGACRAAGGEILLMEVLLAVARRAVDRAILTQLRSAFPAEHVDIYTTLVDGLEWY